MNTSQIHAIAEQLGTKLKMLHLQLASAESCTGGQLAQTITSIPGSSQWFERGFVTYSLRSKQELLGISANTLEQYSPYSKEIVEKMARGVLQKSPANISIAITGIAGPEGGTKENPVGTIYFAWLHQKAFCKIDKQHFYGDRLIIRYAAVEFALKNLLVLIDNYSKNLNL